MQHSPGYSAQLVAQGTQGLASGPFSHRTYTIKRPFFTFLGRTLRVYAPDGSLVLFVQHKLFSWKDKWNIFSNDAMGDVLLSIGARQAIALNITTDVFDAASGAVIGTLQSQGLKSIIRDTWKVLGPSEQPIGELTEDSNALLRRIFPILLGKWHMTVNGQEAFQLKQVFKFFTKEFTLEVNPAAVDPRFAIAGALLALSRELTREEASSD
jgi:hypothetical protein